MEESLEQNEKLNEEQQKLVEDNIGLVGYTISNYYKSVPDKEELMSIGYFALTRAALKFEPEQGSKFSSFAVTVIRNDIRMFFRKNSNSMLSISSKIKDYGINNITYEDVIADENQDILNDSFKNEVIEMYNNLDFKNKGMYNDYLNGMGQHELSKKYGISKSYASRTIKNTTMMLRAYKDYLSGFNYKNIAIKYKISLRKAHSLLKPLTKNEKQEEE